MKIGNHTRISSLLACIFAVAVLSGAAAAQETFKNPAMEPEGEFDQAFALARKLAREGNPDEAVKQLKKAASLRNEQCAECFQMIGQIYFQMTDFKNATTAFKQAVALKPGNEAALYNALGAALYMQKDKKVLEEAVSAFERAIELSQGKIAKAHYNLGYALIKIGKEAEGIAALKSYLEVDPATNHASEVRAIIANPRLVFENFAPGFKVQSIAGEELSLEKYKGRIVLLDFWATWCGPCRVEMPEVKKLWKKYGGDDFVILGISIDEDMALLESYLKEEEITWPQHFDANRSIAALYRVEGIPHTVLIDQDGIIRGVGYRGSALSGKVGDLIKKLHKARSPGSEMTR
jgi:tetratricopeptide (TPR) repeat protein